MCVITSRQSIPTRFVAEALEIKLDELEDSATRIILRKVGFEGSDDELKTLTCRLNGHALTTKLLASNLQCKSILAAYKQDNCNGTANELIDLLYKKSDPDGQNILKLLGLFDRPIAVELLKQLITDSTDDQTQALPETSDLNIMIKKLVEVGLIETIDIDEQPHIDCHPITREFFYKRTKPQKDEKGQEKKNFWQATNHIIYEHYYDKLNGEFKNYQDVINLILAIRHGVECVGFKKIKLEDIYQRYNDKANKGEQSQIINDFGSLELDLACLFYFFKSENNEQDYKELIGEIGSIVIKDNKSDGEKKIDGERVKGTIYSWIAHALLGLGKLTKAAIPMEQGFETRYNYAKTNKTFESYKDAAVSAANLTDLYLTKGRLTQASEWAEQGFKVISEGLGCPKQDGAKEYELQYEKAYNDAIKAIIGFYQKNDAKGLFEQAETHHKQAAEEEAEKKNKEKIDEKKSLLVGTYGFYYCQYLLHELNKDRTEVAMKFEDLLNRAKLIQNNPEPSQHHLHLSLAYLIRANTYYLVRDYNKAQQNIKEALKLSQKAGFHFYRCLTLLVECKTFIKLREFDKAWQSLDKVYQIEAGEMDLIKIQYHITCCDLLLSLIHI